MIPPVDLTSAGAVQARVEVVLVARTLPDHRAAEGVIVVQRRDRSVALWALCTDTGLFLGNFSYCKIMLPQ